MIQKTKPPLNPKPDKKLKAMKESTLTKNNSLMFIIIYYYNNIYLD